MLSTYWLVGTAVLLLSLFECVLTATSTGYFWHVSDIHYDPTYWTEGISCHTDPGDVSTLGRFGHHYCDPPWDLVEDSLDEMVRREPNPDFVVWTGDTSYHFSRAKRPLQDALDVIRKVSEAIAQRFPSVPIIPSLGNNDFVPKNVAGVNYSQPYSEIAEIWQDWIGDADEINLFQKGGYFSKAISPKLRILSINTILYIPNNHVTPGMEDPADQFKWMEEVFQSARQNGEKLILTGHVQPGFRTPGLKKLFQLDFLRRYTDLLTSYADVIVSSHYGHDHADGFKLLQRNGDPLEKTVPVFTALSVTPRQRDSSPSYPHNPSVRLVEYDRDSGLHVNYKQFFINLTDSNDRNETNWMELYNFRETYGVPDMSSVSLNAILNRMIRAHVMRNINGSNMAAAASSDDPMPSYCRYIVGTALPRHCPVIDQAQIWCGAQTGDPDAVEACVQRYIGAEEVVNVNPNKPCGNGSGSGRLMISEISIAAVLIYFIHRVLV